MSIQIYRTVYVDNHFLCSNAKLATFFHRASDKLKAATTTAHTNCFNHRNCRTLGVFFVC